VREVNQRPRFHCDFCSKVSTRAAMERHERICWRNPDRVCDLCHNAGRVYEGYGEGLGQYVDCYYCAEFNPAIAEEELG
jgi:hypothetical protein